MPTPSSAVLRRVSSRACLAALRARAAFDALATIALAGFGCSSSQRPKCSFVARSTSDRISVLPSLALVCPSNCGSASRTEMIAVQTLAHVVALERGVLRLHEVARLGVAVDRLGERALEALGVHPAFGGRDAVGVRVQTFVVAGVPLPRDLDLAFGPAVAERADVLEQRLLGVVQVARRSRRCRRRSGTPRCCLCPGRSSWNAIARPRFRNAITWSRSITVAARNSISSNTSGSGQNVTVVPVCPRFDAPTFFSGPCGTPGCTAPPRAFSAAYSWRYVVPSRSTSSTSCARQRVHDRHADAVQPARHLVAAAAELAARVQRGHHDLGRRLALVLRVLVDRDAAAVVDDAHAAVGEQRDVDAGAVARPSPRRPRCRRPPTRGGAGPVGPVDPMYMPGRLRTGSRPSRTWMCSAE